MNKDRLGENSAAIGGRVWSPQVGLKNARRVSLLGRILHANPMAVLYVAVTVVCIVIVSVWMQNAMQTRDSYNQEYGYVDVHPDYDKRTAEVTVVSTGETKEVKLATYNDYTILFETQEQKDEKMAKIDAGTYKGSR